MYGFSSIFAIQQKKKSEMRVLTRKIYTRFVFTKYSPRLNDNGTEVFPLNDFSSVQDKIFSTYNLIYRKSLAFCIL